MVSESENKAEKVDGPKKRKIRYEVAVGLDRGHRTTKLSAGKKSAERSVKIRPSRRKGVR